MIGTEEFILTGDENDIIYCTNITKKMGNMLIDIIDFSDTFITLINNYKNRIINKEYSEDEKLNEHIVNEELQELQNELNKHCHYFRYTDIIMDITQKYLNFSNERNLKNQKYNDYIKFLNEIKDIVPSIQENKDTLSHLEKLAQDKSNSIEKIKYITFKEFTLNQLDIYIYELKILITNIDLYCKQCNKDIVLLNDKEEIFETNNLIAYNYNLVSDFQKFSSVIKGVFFMGGKIFTDEAIVDKKFQDIRFIQIYEFKNIVELLNLSFINLINKNVHISLCANCKQFFIPENRTDEKYCNRPSPDRKSTLLNSSHS